MRVHRRPLVGGYPQGKLTVLSRRINNAAVEVFPKQHLGKPRQLAPMVHNRT